MTVLSCVSYSDKTQNQRTLTWIQILLQPLQRALSETYLLEMLFIVGPLDLHLSLMPSTNINQIVV